MNSRTLTTVMALLAAWGVALAGPPQPGARDSTGSTAAPPTTQTPREGCVTTECHPGIKNRPVLHGPVRVNGCDGCHKLTDAPKHHFEPVREKHELCTLCHDVATAPGALLHTPFAEGACLSCHDPHGGTAPRLLRGERYADTCLTCHKDMTGAHDRVHGPASVGACGACHEPHAARLPKLLNMQGRDLCLKCHLRTELEVQTKSVVHRPVLGECSVCHDPHATDQPGLLKTDPATLCRECHQDNAHAMDAATTQHAAVTTKRACLNCHAAHASDHASLLKDEPQKLCFECHNQAVALPDGTALVNMKQLIETGKSLHGAVSQRGCVECHEIHGGGHRRLLTNEYPSDMYYPFSESTYALCFGCHDKQLAMLASTGGATGFRNGETNLHYVHVNRDQKGRSCRVCHDAHAASREKHIRNDVPFGKGGWKLPINYQQLPDGGSCGGACHAPLEYNRVTPIVYPPHRDGAGWNGENLVPGVRAEPAKTPASPPKK